MEALLSIAVGVLFGAGVFLLLRARTFSVLLGYGLLGYAVNLMLFASGGLTLRGAPLVGDSGDAMPDPLPQALVLTAIVIGFGMTAFLAALALRAFHDCGSDHVDGEERG